MSITNTWVEPPTIHDMHLPQIHIWEPTAQWIQLKPNLTHPKQSHAKVLYHIEEESKKKIPHKNKIKLGVKCLMPKTQA